MMMMMMMMIMMLTFLPSAASTSNIARSARQRAAGSLIKGISLCVSCGLGAISKTTAASTEVVEIDSVEEAADYIQRNCGNVLAASRSCGRLFYRGDISSYSNRLVLKDPPPDLLEEGTYFGQAGAVDYFRALDDKLYAKGCSAVRRGHIATGSPNEAGKWGPIEVVFPRDGDYITLTHDLTFWKDSYSELQSRTQSRGALFWRNDAALAAYLSQEVQINSSLEAALSRGSEVIFAPGQGSGSYVSVPIALSAKICMILGIVPYSSKVKFSKTQGMEIEGDVRKLSNPTRFVFY